MVQIRLGQGLLIVCCVFYLIWWGIAFHPSHGSSHTSGIDGILLLITMILGLAGLVINILGIIKNPPNKGLLSGIVAVAAILSLYFYLQYYRVKPMAGYIYGMIPLVTEALSMGIFEFLTK